MATMRLGRKRASVSRPWARELARLPDWKVLRLAREPPRETIRS